MATDTTALKKKKLRMKQKKSMFLYRCEILPNREKEEGYLLTRIESCSSRVWISKSGS